MATSTPKDTKLTRKRCRPPNTITKIDMEITVSPVKISSVENKQDLETSKNYPKRERKPRKWESFENGQDVSKATEDAKTTPSTIKSNKLKSANIENNMKTKEKQTPKSKKKIAKEDETTVEINIVDEILTTKEKQTLKGKGENVKLNEANDDVDIDQSGETDLSDTSIKTPRGRKLAKKKTNSNKKDNSANDISCNESKKVTPSPNRKGRSRTNILEKDLNNSCNEPESDINTLFKSPKNKPKAPEDLDSPLLLNPTKQTNETKQKPVTDNSDNVDETVRIHYKEEQKDMKDIVETIRGKRSKSKSKASEIEMSVSEPISTPSTGRKRRIDNAIDDSGSDEKTLFEKENGKSETISKSTPRSGKKRKNGNGNSDGEIPGRKENGMLVSTPKSMPRSDMKRTKDDAIDNGESEEETCGKKENGKSETSSKSTPRSGRKRKNGNGNSDGEIPGKKENSMLVATPKSTPRSGRERKNEDAIDDNGESDGETPCKKENGKSETSSKSTPRSGRKRKNGNGNSDGETLGKKENGKSETSSKLTPRSGRKRKTVDYVAMDDGDEETPAKKKRQPRSARQKIEVESKESDTADDTDDYGPETPKSTRKVTTKVTPKPPQKSNTIPCSKCSFVAPTQSKIVNHMAIEHQAWWTEDHPEGLTDRWALNQVVKIKKFMICEKCDKRLNFIQYYHKHVEFCGNEDERFICELCNRSQKSIWKVEHMSVCRRNQAEKEMVEKKYSQKFMENEEEKDETLGRGNKRSAAKKAMSLVQNISKNLDDGTDLVADNSDDPDADVNDDDDQDDDDDGDNEIDEEDELGTDDDGDAEYDVKEFNMDRFLRKPLTPVRAQNELGEYRNYMNVYPDMKKFMKKAWAKELFPDWLPRKQDFILLSLSESEPYLPKNNQSMQFTFEENEENMTLPLFGSSIIDGFPLLYTGLCIWRVAWCPMPLYCRDDQYLAVVGKLDPTSRLSAFHPYACPGNIQVWNTGINNNDVTVKTAARLCYNIVHDYGQATSIQWCPFGCYKSKTSQKKEEVYPRLGLLAVSFTDSTVRIFSLPYMKPGPVSEPPPTYRAVPVLTLVPLAHWDKSGLVCTCIDWIKVKGHTKIMAGYSNGTLRLFNLLSSAPYQFLATTPEPQLLPYHSFMPHGKPLRDITWCGRSDNIIFTGSEDTQGYFWDLTNTMMPLFTDYSGFSVTCLTSSLWHHGVFTGNEDNYAVNWNKTKYLESCMIQYSFAPNTETRKMDMDKFFICSNSATAWEVTVSNWLNFVMVADNRGYINGLPLSNMIPIFADCKGYNNRQLMLTTKVCRKTVSQPEETAEKCSCNTDQSESCAKCLANQSESVLQSNSTIHSSQLTNLLQINNDKLEQSKTLTDDSESDTGAQTSSIYSENVFKFPNHPKVNKGKVQWDMPVRIADTYPRNQREYIKTTDDHLSSDLNENEAFLQYDEHFKKFNRGVTADQDSDLYDRIPFAAIKSVVFNPNHLQCLWVAYGGDAGTVRMVNIQNVIPMRMQRFLRVNRKELEKPDD